MAYRRRSELADLAETVHAHALGQGGVFRRHDLAEWGVDPQMLRQMVASGHWTRLRYGIYTNADHLESIAGNIAKRHVVDVAAVLLSVPDRAAAFGPSAAVLHELPMPAAWPRRVDIVRPDDMDRRMTRTQTTRSRGLPEVRVRNHPAHDLELTTQAGLPVVGRALAAFSSAAEFPLDWAVATLDAVAWQNPPAPREFERLLAAWPALKGCGTLRRAIPLVRCGAQSPFESLSRIRLTARGLPEPTLQLRFDDRRGLIGYVDMAWEDARVIGECDGLGKYATIDDVRAEKIREDRLRALGWVVVRWTWMELMTDPDAVAARIRDAIELQRQVRAQGWAR